MFLRAARAVLLMLLVAGLNSVLCLTETPLPDLPKTVQELAKENTISHHTGVNITEDLSRESLTSNDTGTSAPAAAPLAVPAGGPGMAPGSAPDVVPGPAQAPSVAPAMAPSASSGLKGATSNTSAQSMPHASTPVATPAAASRPPAPTATTESGTDPGAVASGKDMTTKGASIASSSRYGSIAAGTLVAAVVIIGLTGTFMVWKRRSTPYQGLHDTEMAMLRRER